VALTRPLWAALGRLGAAHIELRHKRPHGGLIGTEFARLGVLESQLFTDDKRFDNRQKLSPDPQVKNMINAELDQADSLAAKALVKDPNNANAEFAKILSLGLRSDYAALVEKRNLAAIGYTKQGTALAEQLLKQNPNAYDAYLAVGVENYLSGIEPAPIRWLMAARGVETDKTRGIHDLESSCQLLS